MEVKFSIVGIVTYKGVDDSGTLTLSVQANDGSYHELLAYGRDARRIDTFVYVGNTYRINVCRHWTLGLVICGVSIP